jgi:short-subunit dehydrogenase
MALSNGRKAILAGSAVAGAIAATALIRRRPMDLDRKVVLITGGSRGLGLALARAFADEGARLALCARDEQELLHAKDDLAKSGAEVFTQTCDVTDRAAVERLVRSVVAHYGWIDVLVNNAGIIQVGPIQTLNAEDFEQAMGVMFWGMVYATLAVLPDMQARGSGRIVNITSVGAKVSVPHLLPYSCAKFAAAAFSEGLRAELDQTGVKVVTIAPGLMRTGSYLNALFKGDHANEAVWFSLGSTIPGISMSAERAARQIVSAAKTGRAERILSVPANVVARFHGAFPGLATEVLSLINRLLPSGDSRRAVRAADTGALERPWLSALTLLGRRAAKRFLQPA